MQRKYNNLEETSLAHEVRNLVLSKTDTKRSMKIITKYLKHKAETKGTKSLQSGEMVQLVTTKLDNEVR